MQSRLRQKFQQTVYEYYDRNGRHLLPWRLPAADGNFDPYRILVSEIMLQQTQVPRVIPKYEQFLAQFPTVSSLAQAPLSTVLRAWSGLGYNRRAKFLHQAAQTIMGNFEGSFPQTQAELITLPGVGSNTAGAILAYAFNLPAAFVETNIRTVFIHHFFDDETDIADAAIIELVDETLDKEQPRNWYWALMDYGSFLKQTVGNLNKASKGYSRQSTFNGSRRQIRGQVIRLLSGRSMGLQELKQQIDDERLGPVLDDLAKEGLIRRQNDRFTL